MISKEERIRECQDWVEHHHLTEIHPLAQFADKYGFDPYEDVLFPIGYNTCDRCGAIEISECLKWVDEMCWVDDEQEIVAYNMAQEGADYCALCTDCFIELCEERTR